jgi:hypothetical protein
MIVIELSSSVRVTRRTLCLQVIRRSSRSIVLPLIIGPALICVYINHYIDWKTDHSRPDIGTSGDSPLWRFGCAMLFTVLVMLLALPFESTIRPIPNGSWVGSSLWE